VPGPRTDEPSLSRTCVILNGHIWSLTWADVDTAHLMFWRHGAVRRGADAAREDPLTPRQISRCRRPWDFLATSSVPHTAFPQVTSPSRATRRRKLGLAACRRKNSNRPQALPDSCKWRFGRYRGALDTPIETKLHAHARKERVGRETLVEYLAGVTAKLVLADAPAGFGKTTLVVQRARARAKAARSPGYQETWRRHTRSWSALLPVSAQPRRAPLPSASTSSAAPRPPTPPCALPSAGPGDLHL
jgi:hypothetical protein